MRVNLDWDDFCCRYTYGHTGDWLSAPLNSVNSLGSGYRHHSVTRYYWGMAVDATRYGLDYNLRRNLGKLYMHVDLVMFGHDHQETLYVYYCKDVNCMI